MNAIDVKPSRIEKAKYELGRLLKSLKGDRAGLIAFAGSAHLHCPLTEDYSASRLFLNMMDTDLIITQGTDLAAAIQLALDHVENNDEKFKIFVLVSDGEDHQGEAILFAESARERGHYYPHIGSGNFCRWTNTHL